MDWPAASIAYCLAERYFQIDFSWLPITEKEADDLGVRLMKLGVLEEQADQTLEATLDKETLPKMDEVFRVILDEIVELAGRH